MHIITIIVCSRGKMWCGHGHTGRMVSVAPDINSIFRSFYADLFLCRSVHLFVHLLHRPRLVDPAQKSGSMCINPPILHRPILSTSLPSFPSPSKIKHISDYYDVTINVFQPVLTSTLMGYMLALWTLYVPNPVNYL